MKRFSAASVSLDGKKEEALHKELRHDPVHTCSVLIEDQLVFTYEREQGDMETARKVNSITKSILSAAVGLALDHGFFKSVNEPLSRIFETGDLPERYKELTIEDLLTMRSGIDWAGNKPMIESGDWTDYIFDQPLKDKPGTKFNYVCANSHLLSAAVQKRTSMSAEEFGAKYLFTKLNIKDAVWDKDPKGVSTGGFGLEMKPSDLLAFGSLYLYNGRFGGKAVLNEEWVRTSTEGKTRTNMGNQRYGYHWWVNPETKRLPYFYYAAGSGGKYIFVVPDRKMVCVFTSDYSRKEGVKPFTLFTRHLLNGFKK
ncbi:serine hydrolase [Bacillus sp. H-16]|uniref:serine hydrolase domain-containing protein n=1 Tax=Alteribacter salitolerans TaxID=2912333 RepID=UPI0019628847|nr:serine hydrolase [Alteribacter salitolerans]MBM7094489.1 serine hydrolase [Alteribacter salitolerans]